MRDKYEWTDAAAGLGYYADEYGVTSYSLRITPSPHVAVAADDPAVAKEILRLVDRVSELLDKIEEKEP